MHAQTTGLGLDPYVDVTGDGGIGWADYWIEVPGGYTALQFDALDSRHAWLLVGDSKGQRKLVATSTGWTTHETVATNSTRDMPSEFRFTSPDQGWGVIGHGDLALVNTIDGGRTWEIVRLPVEPGWHIDRLDLPHLWSGYMRAYGGVRVDGARNGDELLATWTSSDGGKSWFLDHTEALGSRTIVASSAGWAIYDRDGRTVTATSVVGSRLVMPVPQVCPAPRSLQVGEVEALSASSAWLAGRCALMPFGGPGSRPDGQDDLYSTTDGGRTWRLLDVHPESGYGDNPER
jgi:hypothetical protein